MAPFSKFVSAAVAVLVVSLAVPAHAAPVHKKAKAAPRATHVVAVRKVQSRMAARAATAPMRVTLRSAQHARPVLARFEPARQSFGVLAGLHTTPDALSLKSSVALVLDQDTDEVLFSKNSEAVLPIASLTKLMTALVVTEAKLDPKETLQITQDDVDTEKMSSSRLTVGTQLTREEMLHLALMSSENRAANSLGRNFPGGLPAFVVAMNRKAAELGMVDTHYAEPTGLSSRNQSSARDLATLVKAAYQHQNIRELSTSPEYQVQVGKRQMMFHSTNGLVRSHNSAWDIGLQKTGFINEAGQCLVMQAQMMGRKLIMVFLDSAGRYSRIGDAERVRKWVHENVPAALPGALPHPIPAAIPSGNLPTTAVANVKVTS